LRQWETCIFPPDWQEISSKKLKNTVRASPNPANSLELPLIAVTYLPALNTNEDHHPDSCQRHHGDRPFQLRRTRRP
jgi:hypothetical protein